MSICGTCGRERGDDDRFCGTCGAEYTDSPDATDSPMAGSVTRIERPAEQSDPFASWYQPPGRLPEGTGQQYQPTQTVPPTPPRQPAYPATAPAAGYQPPQGPPPQGPTGYQGPPPPMGQWGPRPPEGGPRRGGPRGLLIVLAVIVVLAAGGGAYALATTLGKHSTAQPPSQPSVSASASASGSTQPSASPPASAGAGQGPSPTPSPTLSLVRIGSGVTSSAAAAVEPLLSHYFHGINSRDYAEYAATLNAAKRAAQPQSAFDSGFATTQDSGMTLTSLSASGGAAGGLTATVAFTSRQSPGQSVDHSACNDWTLNFYLVRHGLGYLIGPAPSGYQPDHSDC